MAAPAPINNASPIAVASLSALAADTAVDDDLTGRGHYGEETAAGDHATTATLSEAVRDNEEVASVYGSTWVLLFVVTVGR